MAEPTLTEVFGASAIQDGTTLTITKADLPGLTPAVNNRAEALFVGILVKAMEALTATAQGDDPLRQVTIEAGFEQIVIRGENQYRQKTLTINLQKADVAGGIDPDDY
ncbi:hypothetical protein BST81_03570 [Leptolyngbya sp. 'hensonii']|uniref:hypothetical protein n=1 Tax=Leptolyngbya sp. 'hensonii' TaxID=1922337 RepID=UPI00094F6664|nr:hypothetical protein [Leptolyngbya sp. 'hensonii']OLP19822.1 hypothetical protein BST81_03570 [Leptolyngbya sp. 'hensonii']